MRGTPSDKGSRLSTQARRRPGRSQGVLQPIDIPRKFEPDGRAGRGGPGGRPGGPARRSRRKAGRGLCYRACRAKIDRVLPNRTGASGPRTARQAFTLASSAVAPVPESTAMGVRIEPGFLLVTRRGVKRLQRGPHRPDHLQHRVHALFHGFGSTNDRLANIRHTGFPRDVRGLGRCRLERIEFGTRRVGRLHFREPIPRSRNRLVCLAPFFEALSALRFGGTG
jgi:hypothetical protein